jgi:hypothetical protein
MHRYNFGWPAVFTGCPLLGFQSLQMGGILERVFNIGVVMFKYYLDLIQLKKAAIPNIKYTKNARQIKTHFSSVNVEAAQARPGI